MGTRDTLEMQKIRISYTFNRGQLLKIDYNMVADADTVAKLYQSLLL